MNFFILSAWHWVGKGLNIEIQMIHKTMSANIKYNAYHIIQMLLCNVSLLKMCCWWLLIPFFKYFMPFYCWSMSFVQIWNANNVFVNVLSPNFYHYEENVSREKESRDPKMLSCPSKIDWFVYKKRIRNGLV